MHMMLRILLRRLSLPSSKAWPGYSISIGIWQSAAGATTKTGSRDRSRPRQRKCLSLFNDLSTLLLKKREKRSRSISTRGTPPCSLKLTLSSQSQLAAFVTGLRDVGCKSRRGKIGVTGPGKRIARISGIAMSGEAGNYQGCTIV